jgi:tetratricopeptide (TPR) repeat protein
MARRTGQPDALISTLQSRLLLELQSPDVAAMLQDAQEVLALLDHGAPTWDRNFSTRLLIMALLRLGRRADAERNLETVEKAAAHNGARLATHNAGQIRSALATASGRFAEGKALAAETAQRAGRHIPVVELGYVAQILAGRMEQGRLDEVIAALDGLDRLELDLPAWRAMRTGALAEAGRIDEASESLQQIMTDVTSIGDAGVVGPAPMTIRHLPEVCRRLGDTTSAATLLTHVTPWAGQMLVATWGLSIDGATDRAIGHLLATLGRLDEADTAYTSAAELEHSAGFPPLIARTHYWHARALLERNETGDHERARDLLDGVIEVASRVGMSQLHQQATSARALT